MFIRVEPAGFFMYTVQMVFDPAHPDSEDQEVRDYLAQHELEPRYQWEGDFEGRQCQWLQFGGCYLGKHLQGIGQLQRHAVEVELLTAEIDRCWDNLGRRQLTVDEAQREEVMGPCFKNSTMSQLLK